MKLNWKTIAGLVIGIGGCLLLWFMPIAGLDIVLKHAIAIITLAVVFWIFEPVPPDFTALIFMVLLWVLQVVKPSVAFSGFTDTSTTWLIMGAFFISALLDVCGLGKRIIYKLMTFVPATYSGVLLIIFITCYVATFLIPSATARVALIAPLAYALIPVFGLDPKKKSNIGTGLLAPLGILNQSIAKGLLTGGVASAMVYGILISTAKVTMNWLQWWIIMLPFALLVTAMLYFATRYLFPPEVKEVPGGAKVIKERYEELGPWTREQKRVLCYLVCMILLYVFDSLIFKPVLGFQIGTSQITLLVCIALFMPGIGCGVPWKTVLKRVNWGTIIFTAGIVGLVNIAPAVGLDKALYNWIYVPMTAIAGKSLLTMIIALFLVMFACSWFGGFIIGIALFLPPFLQYAMSVGISPVLVALIFDCLQPIFFVYQCSIALPAYQFEAFDNKSFTKLGIVYSIGVIIIMYLLSMTWFPLMIKFGLA